MGRKSEENIQEEAQRIIYHVCEKNSDNEDFLVDDFPNIFVVNVIWKMAANKTFSYDCKEDFTFVQTLNEFMGKVDSQANIPFIGKFTSSYTRKEKQWIDIKTAFLKTIEEHERSLGKICKNFNDF